MSAFDHPLTREDIYRAKAEQRKLRAKAPFASKLRDLVSMQHINLEVKKAVGRKAPRPWNMSEEEYQSVQKLDQ